MSDVEDCKIVRLHRHLARQGNLTAIEGNVDIPFPIERVYYLYDLPGGESRGGHAHLQLKQMIVCVMGSLDIVLDDGEKRRRVHLDRAYQGLLIPRMIWRVLDNFSSGSICVVLASHTYDESDYIRDYERFLSLARQK